MRPNVPMNAGRQPPRGPVPKGAPRPKGPAIKHLGGPKRGRRPRAPKLTSPTAPLGPKQFNREVRATTNLQVRPLERQLASEFKGSQVREQQQIPSWFAQYQNQLQNYSQNTQQAYNQAQDRYAQQLAQANQQDAAARDQVAQRSQADAQLRGANVSTAPQDAAANANARRVDLGAFQTGVMGTQGANAYAYLQNRGAIAGREMIDQQQQEALRRQKITSDQRALEQKRADIANQARQDLRKAERDYKVQLMAFSRPTANQALSSATSRRDAALSAKTSRANALLSAQQSNINSIRTQKGENKRSSTLHPQKGQGGRTPSEVHSDRQAFHNAYSAAQNLYHLYSSQNKAPSSAAEWQNFKALLVHGGGQKSSISPLGGSNPHLWANRAVKKLQARLTKQGQNQAPTKIPGGGTLF